MWNRAVGTHPQDPNVPTTTTNAFWNHVDNLYPSCNGKLRFFFISDMSNISN